MKVREDYRIISIIIINITRRIIRRNIFYEKEDEERGEDDYEDSNQTRMNSS